VHYLLLGPELGRKDQALQKIIQQLKKKHHDLEIKKWFLPDDSMDQIISEARNSSLFADHRLFIVYQAELALAPQVKTLKTFFDSAPPDISLIFLSDEIGRKTKPLEAAFPKKQVTIFWELRADEKISYIQSLFRQKNKTIDDDGISTLLEMTESSSDEMLRTVQQLSLYYKDEQHISKELVESYLFHSKEESFFTLFNALASRELEQSLEILIKLYSTSASQINAAYPILYTQFRRILEVHEYLSLRYSFEESCKKAGVTSKIAQRQIHSATKHYDAASCARIMDCIVDFESDSRQSGTSAHYPLLSSCIYTIVCRSGLRTQTHPEFRIANGW
jgi:DNA polymerase-3 subunit delta